eukprot:GEMP01041329.1.p1 GENE.GEMP01041329.1~~GEMP01041329.1.p1  ORF type:complete len:271 (+),score=74.17 GEMP01041329.1:79-891(+)
MTQFFRNTDRTRSLTNQMSTVGCIYSCETAMETTSATGLIPVAPRRRTCHEELRRQKESSALSLRKEKEEARPLRRQRSAPLMVKVLEESYLTPSRFVSKGDSSISHDGTWGRAEWMRGQVPLERIQTSFTPVLGESWGDGPDSGDVDRWGLKVLHDSLTHERKPLQITRKDMPPPTSQAHLAARLTAWSGAEAVPFYRAWVRTRPKKKRKVKTKKKDAEVEPPEESKPRKRRMPSWTLPSIEGAPLNAIVYVGKREFFSSPPRTISLFA